MCKQDKREDLILAFLFHDSQRYSRSNLAFLKSSERVAVRGVPAVNAADLYNENRGEWSFIC